MEVKKAVFVTSITQISQMVGLPGYPEIAVIGRSNVGKSSLINALAGTNKLAKVSASPGKTRLINLFNFNDLFYLVDLPGYGFANVSKDEQDKWGGMIEAYLSRSKQLKHILLLLDIRHKPTEQDIQMAYWVQHYGIPCTIVATKADKIAKSKRKPMAAKLSDDLSMTFRTHTILFSAQESTGTRELLTRLGQIASDTVPDAFYKRD